VTLDAYSHQDVPFEAVLASLRLDRDLSRTPLFQVLFNMLNLPRTELALPGLGLEVLSPPEMPSKFDMTFYLSELASGVRINLVYNADLFDEARMADLLVQLELLLEQAVRRPEEPLESFPLVSQTMRRLLPDPLAPLDAGWLGGVHDLFGEAARRHPEKPAVVDFEGSWTYDELREASLRLVGWLSANGVRPGDPVAIFAHRSAPVVQAVMGVLSAGAAFMFLDPAYPASRLVEMIEQAEPRAWVGLEAAGAVPEPVAAWLTAHRRPRLDLPGGGGQAALAHLARFAGHRPEWTAGPDDLACISFTSGSTGRPRGILGLHGSLSHFLPWFCATFGLGADDRVTLLSGLAHDPLQRDIFTSLYLGATIVVPDPAEIGIAGRLAAWMNRERVTVANLTPAFAQLLTEPSPEGGTTQVPSLSRVLLIGEALSRLDVSRLRALAPQVTCFNLYGSTETQRALAYHVVPEEESAALSERARQILPLGRGIRDVQLLVLNRAGQLAGLGEIGEIVMRSPHLARGYLGEEALTADRFRLNPFTGEPGDRVYRTGDLGRYLPNGEVAFAGRADQQVKLRGFRIELGEIEAALALHPGVRLAVVGLREDHGGDKRLVAYVVPAVESAVATADLHDFLWQRLPAYMVPSAFLLLEAMPLNPNGKVDRRALGRLPWEISAAGGEARTLRTPVEEIVAGLWSEVLGIPNIGPDDNFFQLGGHSLTGAQVVSRLRQALGVELPLRVLFQAPTVATLAAEVSSRRRQDGAPELPSIVAFHHDRSTPAPLSFAQERFWEGRQLEARTVASTIPIMVLFEGLLSQVALKQALQEVVQRHEVLRTSFADAPGHPIQVVDPALQIELRIVDLERVAPLHRMAEVRYWSTVDGRMPFDFERGPLFRLTLFRCSATENVLLFVVHHVAFDGWSRSVLIAELAALYNAFREGRPSPLRPLLAQYQDFARWQRQVLDGETLAREVGFWREHLAGAVPVRLGGDRPALEHPTFDAGIELFTVPVDLERRLEAFAAEQCVTPFMTLLAAFKTLLYLETGQDDVVVTSLFANRNQLEIENLIGNFFAGLPLRTRLAGARSFRELLERVRDVTLAAHEHPDIQYEPVMEGLSFLEPGDRGGLASFRILFQLQNLPPAEQDLTDLKVIRLPFDTGKIRQDLSLFLSQSGRLSGRFKYNRDVLDQERVVHLRDRFLQILAAFVDDPERPLEALLPESPDFKPASLAGGNGGGQADLPEGIASFLRLEASTTYFFETLGGKKIKVAVLSQQDSSNNGDREIYRESVLYSERVDDPIMFSTCRILPGKLLP
jgi:amino acid adenylation domain-containing protein